ATDLSRDLRHRRRRSRPRGTGRRSPGGERRAETAAVTLQTQLRRRSPRAASSELVAHDQSATVLPDSDESVPLVEVQRRVVGLDAEADRGVALPARLLEQRFEQLLAVPLAAAARDNRDRQLRRLLVHEAVARPRSRKESVPG